MLFSAAKRLKMCTSLIKPINIDGVEAKMAHVEDKK